MRFVEGGPGHPGGPATTRGGGEPDHKDFWDDFSSLADQRAEARAAGSGAIGTAAMGKKAGAGGKPPAKKQDDWDDW
jgi:ADP-ribosylation factor GTPase-activating protein 1